MGVLFVISGPSGVGKGTLVEKILERDNDLSLSVSCTTRERRGDEIDGKHYFFITKEEFLHRISRDGFLEWDEHFGKYYGTPKPFVLEELKTKSVILEIDVQGALSVRSALRGTETEPVLIFIAPPSIEALRERIGGRGTENDEEIESRIARAKYELSRSGEYDYRIINDDVSRASDCLFEIIRSEKNKRR